MNTAPPVFVFVIAVLVRSGVCVAEPFVFSYYVGRRVCIQCHEPGATARPCSLERISAHERSYDALSTPEAHEIAGLCGVAEPPRKSRICLSCHATSADAGPRWTTGTFDIKHGVQCEACHDAGSLHIEAYRSREEGRTLGRIDGIRCADESTCKACHVERPSHKEVLVRGYRQAAADRLYKTPVNMAVSPDGKYLYVVCEHSNSLMVLDPRAGRVLDEIAVGRQPHDVAVSPDGQSLYVTNRLDDTLTVIDAVSKKVVTEIVVGDDPHGVLLDRTGRRVFVLNTAADSISVIDSDRRAEVKRLVAGRGPWSLALREDGESFYVTSIRPNPGRFREPPDSEVTVASTKRAVVTRRIVVPEANMLQGIASVPGRDVAILTLMRTKNLVPITRLAQGWTITNGLGVLWLDGRVDQVLLDEPNASFPDPWDVAAHPDGRHVLVTSGGSDEIAVVDVSKLLETITSASPRDRAAVLPNHLGMSSRFVLKRIQVGRNPRSVVFSPDGRLAYVANALDDSISIIETADYTVKREIALGGPEEITEIRWGERLFHSASVTFGSQFSCRSCHPDGHINGLTFDIEADGIGMNPVDNRTLRGILDTSPFKWEGTNPSLHRQCGPRLAMFFTRLAPLTPAELNALVRYVSTITRPPNRNRRPEGLSPAQRRGKAVFERAMTNEHKPIPPEGRCTTCHNGPNKTARNKSIVGTTMWFDGPAEIDVENLFDTESFGQLGIVYFYDTGAELKSLDAPHLNNLYGSAPYLHNGAAATLEEIWTRYNLYGGHGEVRDLTRRQFNDLIAYLKSL